MLWRSKYKFQIIPSEDGNHIMSHHYSVLGLDRFRCTPYSDEEIKTAFRAKAMKYHPDQNPDNKDAAEAKFKELQTAFRAKAMKYHPDQNPDNKDAAEAKFKEVMISYEAIKLERKRGIVEHKNMPCLFCSKLCRNKVFCSMQQGVMGIVAK
ncbi:hypothetical protein HPP92_011733 [Vanilla planifolia]|uniref:J domain-containing protein n=1 Tax=Vanilla planifolia TaxID=51239 RepID=A0A835QW87_VANPL|nr:hypothetical protein HPP92_011733 [Vanilla planifolia]